MKNLLAVLTVRASPDVISQSLAQIATEGKVFEEEGVSLVELFQISNIVRLSFFAHDHFKVHDSSCLCFTHLQCPDT